MSDAKADSERNREARHTFSNVLTKGARPVVYCWGDFDYDESIVKL